MKNVITAIEYQVMYPKLQGAGTSSFPIIPGSGSISAKTSQDGLTQEITVTARIAQTYPVPEDYTSDMSSITVRYSDEIAGDIKSMTFGSSELPARFVVEDNATMSIKCTYTRVL
ncbi:MAG: hypothetical protein IJV27_12570 [Prevotella sp.]|nr:hypothetical protein [Prevotella sp.]